MTNRRKIISVFIIALILSGVYLFSVATINKQRANELQHIDIWLQSNNFNTYGDPFGTVYPGGTPLFDEETGKRESRLQYLLRKYPDKPWNK